MIPPRPSLSSLALRLGIPLAAVVTGLWVVNTYFSPGLARTILIILLLFLAVLLVFWLLLWTFRKLQSAVSGARAQRRAAHSAAPVSGVSAHDQGELDAFQQHLNQAVRVIGESKLARGRRSDEALYALPWILLLGPSGSGKTTFLRDSGVDFPYSTGEGRKSRKGS